MALTSEKMFNWDEEWNISFAGCGFRSIYYLGALSCILEEVPQLVHGASKICGASSGCLVAAALTVGIPIEQLCVDVLNTAKEARKHTLGVFHPTFSLLRIVRESLLERLPADAHLRASGKLCVSLTRLADGKNILVSEFDSREELIQVLMCSCFFPIYCGFMPPSYRGVLYMDGALSNNMPLFEQRNTITMAPFSGESDICPSEGTFNFLEVHYGNVSIQVNTGNVYRVWTSFLSPRLEKLAEICHNGYKDALSFLSERDLLGQHLTTSLVADTDAIRPACCEQAEESKTTLLNGQNPQQQEDHLWLDQKVIENLPVSFKKVLCEACRDSHDGSTQWSQLIKFLPAKVLMYLLTFLMLPVELTFLLTKSMISGCAATSRLLTSTAELCRLTWNSEGKEPNSAFPEQRCSSRSYNSDLRTQIAGDKNIKRQEFQQNSSLDPSTPKTPSCGKMTLNHRSKQMCHQP
ncbi:patatin-like phospholipase domain-containing protein 2 [Micropterus dolomieu]|uniref:patatin-like phospholipase domain-containing protein 2 n=1 Tax=Micropterus dolomieu TaxID=147949 RepID=UPI001E8E3115|nr:patatin-like phospholipase domain-containing protein 2 [Micropterus dolomieu]